MVTINYGQIFITNIGGFHGTLEACVLASCSSVVATGVELSKIHARALQLGFAGILYV